MMKYVVLIVVLIVGGVYLFLPYNNEGVLKHIEASASNTLEKGEQLPAQNGAELVKQPLQNGETQRVKDAETTDLSKAEVIKGIDALITSIIGNNEIDFELEKSIVAYLKSNDDYEVYHHLLELLNEAMLGTKTGDRLTEYCLSLLAAVGTISSTELILKVVNEKDWEGSEAVYLVNKAVSSLNRDGEHTTLIEQAFTQSSDGNPYLTEIAANIAKHAQVEQITYLFSFIEDGSSSKDIVASNAMSRVQNESLVPAITEYLTDNNPQKVDVALSSLANMGQYEAASSLIAWSATQSIEETSKVASLFDIATRRSPSTARAIKKEASQTQFLSDEVKALVLSYSVDRSLNNAN
ncbi:hypothetical protein L2735_17785 [Shewanella olleyana]|uniref:hypothetical protein n=1 Tax=Shewanella olleyana TaxID=135626 RepID=UPI00200C5EFA|nr:hypothetical protein [Shewanella olleyana]MCL1068625.1 hypothetical protein [Shewanella olleyana]